MATIFTDNFNSYTDGDLNGQGSWSGSTSFDVQTSVKYEGAKAISNSYADTGLSISKTGTTRTAGRISLYMRVDGASNLALKLLDGSTEGIWVNMVGEGGGYYWQYKDGSGYHNSGISWVASTWYCLEVEWLADDTYRFRVDGGAWHGYYSAVNAWNAGGGLDKVYFNYDNTGTCAGYIDYIDENTYPTGKWTVDAKGYDTRKKLTIDQTKIDTANLTDFPVLVKLSSTNFNFSHANADGFDIRFTASDGTTLLKYERERHDDANDLAEYWVKIPTVSYTADTDFYMYYRTTDTADGADPTNVWDSYFVGVWHMNDATTSTFANSTATSHTATKHDANEPNQVDAEIAKGQDFDGTDDLATTDDSDEWTMGAGDWTVETMTYMEADQGESMMVNRAVTNGSAANAAFHLYANNYKPRVFMASGSTMYRPVSADALSANAWHHIVGRRISGTLTIWADSANKANDATLGTATMNDPSVGICFGNEYPTANNYFNGRLDEVRISKGIGRADEWIKATYYSNFNTLLTYGSEEGGGTNMKINVGDTWKPVSGAKINVGDTWKAVTKGQVNIGDTWKTIF